MKIHQSIEKDRKGKSEKLDIILKTFITMILLFHFLFADDNSRSQKNVLLVKYFKLFFCNMKTKDLFSPVVNAKDSKVFHCYNNLYFSFFP